MKKLLIWLLILLIGLTCVWFFLSTNKNNLAEYKDGHLSFTYPKNLSLGNQNGSLVLHHDIAYKNSGDCDMVGDGKIYEKLTDFNLNIRIIEKNLTETIKQLSPYIPEENFKNGGVVENPGFIDLYHLGDWKGYTIYEGAEGCGQVTYYFPVNSSQTLVLNNASIQALSASVNSKEEIEKVLSVPEVISSEENRKIFTKILESLEVN